MNYHYHFVHHPSSILTPLIFFSFFVFFQPPQSEAPIREALDRQSSTRAVKRRLKGLRARFPAPTI